MDRAALEIRQVGPSHEAALVRFFEAVRARGMDKFFHPHALDATSARARARYQGKDCYVVLVDGDEILAYGMLRGRDEGYEIPSLGIAVHPDCQGRGFGRMLMQFLHAASARRGETRIRLRVSPDNESAVALYRSLGYTMAPDPDGLHLVGYLDLPRLPKT